MRGISVFLLSIAMPAAGFAAADLALIMRALTSSRGSPQTVQPRQQQGQAAAQQQTANSWEAYEYQTLNKLQYVEYLKNASVGARSECRDKFNKYVSFFSYYGGIDGEISGNGNGSGRLDTVCSFFAYPHWCFAMGYAFAVRDPEDPLRTGSGSKCYTYSEYCLLRNKKLSEPKLDDYMSRIMDEINNYYTKVADQNDGGGLKMKPNGQLQFNMAGNGQIYDVDSWVASRVSAAEMTKLLCK